MKEDGMQHSLGENILGGFCHEPVSGGVDAKNMVGCALSTVSALYEKLSKP